MTSRSLPRCPVCATPVQVLRVSVGVVAAYPCLHWLTPGQADDAQVWAPLTATRRRCGCWPGRDCSALHPAAFLPTAEQEK
ncbi:hypothetical protein [Verrucosispora sp. TAA-831]|uniref:hypothetical protein n=1 Tax=Verrucosispora sp. TAA-831 TaxID=3422227 RepID=UPI003D6EBA10